MTAFLAFLLAVPVLNLVVAPLVGIYLLMKLISRGGASGVLLGLAGAAFWAAIACLPLLGNTSSVAQMLGALSFVANFAFSYFFLDWVDSKYRSRIDAQLKKFQEEIAPKGNFAPLIGPALGPLFTFDKEKRVFVFVTEGEIIQKPFDYIRTWELQWVERTKNGHLSFTNVCMQFRANDIDRPRIVVPMSSKEAGDELDAKLGILMA